MSLLNKTFSGKLSDGAYTGIIKAFKEEQFQTDKGVQEAVRLTLQVGQAEYDFILFEKPFEWAMKDLADTYFSGMMLSAGEILQQVGGKTINFSLYSNEYAGRTFQRLSFNPNYTQPAEAGSNEPLEFAS